MKVNKPRTIALKLISFLVIIALLNFLASMSISIRQWWHAPMLILDSIMIIICSVLIVGGQVREIPKKDDDLLD
jgi:hypothetical protein